MSFAKSPSLAGRLVAPFVQFAALEASSAMVLLAASVLALAAANSPLGPAWER